MVYMVVPYVGTWIEMQKQTSNDEVIESFPTWERG